MHDRIAATFGKQSSIYNKYALVQRYAANRLNEQLPDINQSNLNILEIGCGTGLVTKLLVEKYPNANITVSDISAKMLDVCKSNLIEAQLSVNNISFLQLDVENEILTDNYDLIVSGLTAQWFDEFEGTIRKVMSALNPDGFFVLSFLTDDSFHEWKQICAESNLMCTANRLPKRESVHDFYFANILQYTPFSLELRFIKSIDFFKSLKAIGASTQKDGLYLNVVDFRALTKFWDRREKGSISATYKGLIVTIQHAK